MKKLRSSLVAIALVVFMSGSALLGVGAGSIANTASSQHIAASSVVGKSVQTATRVPRDWCPVLGIAC